MYFNLMYGVYLILSFFLLLFSPSSNCTYANIEIKINLLKNCLLSSGINNSKICLRDTCPKYEIYNFQWNLRESGQIHAPIYLLPTKTKDVQKAVICCKELGVSISPKSGGHNLERYSFGNSHSLVIDLRNMDKVRLDYSDNLDKIVQIGPGNLNGPVIYKLNELGDIYLPISVCVTVGIAGFATGGGYTPLIRNYGISMDYLTEMTVVVASGEILIANSSSNPDLFYALRGAGGGSFGIITKFKFRYEKQPINIKAIRLFYHKKDFENVFSIWQEYFTESESGKNVPNYINSFITVKFDLIILALIESSGESENTKLFNDFIEEFPKPMRKITNFYPTYLDFIFQESVYYGTLKKGTLKKASDLKYVKRSDEAQVFRKTKSFFGVNPFSKSDLKELSEFINSSPNSVRVYFVAWGEKVSEFQNTSFIHRQKRAYLSKVDVFLPGDKISESKTLIKKSEKQAKKYFEMTKRMINHTESYQNYEDAGLSDYLNRYYGTALERLIEIKREYDPTNFFNNPQSIPLFA